MASWSGNPNFTTKNQLLSSVSGLYTDLQDISGFSFQNLTLSTLIANQYISTPVLYVSDLRAENIDISGIFFDASGIFFAPLVSSTQANFNIINISSMKFEFNPTFSGDFKLTFDLQLGQAIGGLLGGLGAAVGGAFIGVGTGVGLIVQGLTTGIATIIAGRGDNYINNNVYETINFTSQLQISTIGNAFPLYSTIFRTVSSVSADSVPGREIFTSTFFNPGTTCIRTASDPFNLISGNSNLVTSSIQSFGQWIPFANSNFSYINLSNTTDQPLLEWQRDTLSLNQAPMFNGLQNQNSSNNLNFPATTPFPNIGNVSKVFYHRDEYSITNNFVSSPYVRFQSTITLPGLQFIGSGVSTPAEITYLNPTFPGNIAFCDPNITNFRSTATFDIRAIGQDLFIDWGLNELTENSTIAANTAKRVSWDNVLNTSNFIDIPQALSTVTNGTTQQILDIKTNPYEWMFNTLGDGMLPSQVAWNVQGMTFGSNTSLFNYNNYPYAFTSSLYVNGTIEAQTIIALSSIFATSTFVDTQVSTASIVTDIAQITQAYIQEGYVSTLKSTSNFINDYIYAKSRIRLAGYDTPLSLVVGKSTDFYDPSVRFDFNTNTTTSSFNILSQPSNNSLATFTQSNVQINNLAVTNLEATNLIYSNAEAPNIQTSTIQFGWTGFNPSFSLSQNLLPQSNFLDYASASNQVLNIMNFSNTIAVNAQQFSTPLVYTTTNFGASNIQGWASTIFTNNRTTAARVFLQSNAGFGELSLQAASNNIFVNVNTSPNEDEDISNLSTILLSVPSTIKFTCGGSTWTTNNQPPIPGIINYANNLTMSMDFENTFISTTDTLNINAEKINLNGQVVAPNLRLGNIIAEGFVSTNQLFTGPNGIRSINSFTGALSSTTNIFPMRLTYNVTPSDNRLNIRNVLNTDRGFNLFNGLNLNEWNNTVFTVDSTTSLGEPTIIVANTIQTGSLNYVGQFWINNLDPFSVSIYQNNLGVLTRIGGALGSGTRYTRVSTADGFNWVINSNVPNPQGITPVTYTNDFRINQQASLLNIDSTMPTQFQTPTFIYFTNKVFYNTPQIRVFTIGAPSFGSREAGFEYSFYFDSNVVFTNVELGIWQSDAFNVILNYNQTNYYSLAAYECMPSLTRIRTDANSLLQFEISPAAYPVGGGASDFVWGTTRFIQVRNGVGPSGSLIERYFMMPRNYQIFNWQGQIPN